MRVSGPEILPIVKAIGSAAAKPGTSWLKRKTVPWRVARATSKEVRQHGIQASPKHLRRWLTTAIEAGELDGPTDRWLTEASHQLAWALPGRDDV